jgi:hypothetical protein
VDRKIFTRTTGPLHGFYANAFLGKPGQVFSGSVPGAVVVGQQATTPEFTGSVYDLMRATGKSAYELLLELGGGAREMSEAYGRNVVYLAESAGGGAVHLAEHTIDALRDVAVTATSIPKEVSQNLEDTAKHGADAVEGTGNGLLLLAAAVLVAAAVIASDAG